MGEGIAGRKIGLKLTYLMVLVRNEKSKKP